MFNQISIAGRLRDSLLRHRWLFLLSLLLVSGITMGAVLLRPKTYAASASTQVVTDSQQVADALGEKYRYLYVSSAQQHVNHFNDLVNDDLPGGFWDTALQNANLSVPIKVDPRVKDPRFTTLRKQLSANADSQTMFSISLVWNNPAECERMVEALQNQYREEVKQEQTIKSTGVSSFLIKEIGEYERRLQEAEKAVSNYKRTHSGLLPGAQAGEYDNLSQIKQQRDKLLISEQGLSLKTSAYQTRLAQIPPQIISEQLLTDSASAKALAQLEGQRIQLLSTGVAPGSTRLAPLEVQIARLQNIVAAERAKIAQLPNTTNRNGNNTSILQTKVKDNPAYIDLKQQLLDAQIDQKRIAEQIKNANTQIAQYEKTIAAIPEAERELTRRVRDYDLLKAQYEGLKDRSEQARVKAELDSLTAADTLIPVGAIFANPTQGQAKTLLMLAGSLILALIVATGMVVFSEWNDPTLRYPADVERILELPVLASVPELAAIDTTQAGGTVTPDALPGGMNADPSLRFGRNNGGLAARNPSMGTFGP